MWIERIDFAGFGKLSGDKIEFKPNKLNLIVEPNDYGKSTIAEAIIAILYDFPPHQTLFPSHICSRDSRRPSRPPFLASIDVSNEGRSLKVIRDFEDGSVQVVDRSKNNQDVTAEFRGPLGEDQVGLKITGMARDLFTNTFYVGQRRLNEHAFESNAELLSMFQTIADSSTSGGNANNAIGMLNDALANFSYKGSHGKIDTIIRDLEVRQADLKVRANTMLEQKRVALAEFGTLQQIARKLHEGGQGAAAEEYFAISLTLIELDERLARNSDRTATLEILRADVQRLSEHENLPTDHRQLDDLWGKQRSKREEYEQLVHQIGPSKREYDEEHRKLRERFPGLEDFSIEDVQNLSTMASSLQSAEAELFGLSQKRQDEYVRVRDQQSIDVDHIEKMRKSLFPLDAKDVDNARTYDALIMAARAQLVESERLIAQAHGLLNEIEEEKRSKKGFFATPAHRKREVELAEKEIEMHTLLIQELQLKVRNLEKRLDGMTKKAGLKDVQELLGHVQEYSSKSGAIRDIETLNQVIASREATLSRLRQDLAPFFEKSKRKGSEITSESAQAMATEVARYTDEFRTLTERFSVVSNGQQQLEALTTEISDIEGLLESMFMGMNMTTPSDLEASYAEAKQQHSLRDKWESAKLNLARFEAESAATPHETAELEQERAEKARRMQELTQKHPDLQEMTPQPPGSQSLSLGTESDLEQLKDERDRKMTQVRNVLDSFDEMYLDMIQDLDRIQRDLTSLRQFRAAIALARETLQRVSGDAYVDWTQKLNSVSMDLLATLDSDLHSIEFSQDLKLSVQRKGQQDKLFGPQIKAGLSPGSRDQVHLLARIIICRFLSVRNPMPIILDESFSELDDTKFLRTLQFLLETICKQNQIIVLSSHHIRYHWLIQNLNDNQKRAIELCKKSALRSEPVRS